MKRTALLPAAALLCASAALAHTGVRDPAVKARMHDMEELAQATEKLGLMAKGQATFDPRVVAASLGSIRDHAAAIPGLFETPAQDPKSEALDTIWTDWDDFVERSDALALAAATPPPAISPICGRRSTESPGPANPATRSTANNPYPQ